MAIFTADVLNPQLLEPLPNNWGLPIKTLALPLDVEGHNNMVLDCINCNVDIRSMIGGHEEAITNWVTNLV